MSIEVKIQCDCGTRYKFDVTPLHGRMPQRVSCPGCGVDGTPAANDALHNTFRHQIRRGPSLLRGGGFGSGVTGAILSGIVAMLTWFLLIRLTGHQMGFAAWGVGLIVGQGARWLGREGGRRLGLAAGGCAFAAILGGQLLAAQSGAASSDRLASGGSFGWLTILWMLMAVLTAFKLGSNQTEAA